MRCNLCGQFHFRISDALACQSFYEEQQEHVIFMREPDYDFNYADFGE